MLGPKENRLSWDDTFMLLALVIAQRSADPATQVGSIVTSRDNRVIGLGYNGPPRGISVNQIPWDKEGPIEKQKYPYIAHAEYNALTNCTSTAAGGKIYVTLQPCNTCAVGIIQAGIKEVIYFDDKYKDVWFTKVALDMFNKADVKVRKHNWGSLDSVRQLADFVTALTGG